MGALLVVAIAVLAAAAAAVGAPAGGAVAPAPLPPLSIFKPGSALSPFDVESGWEAHASAVLSGALSTDRPLHDVRAITDALTRAAADGEARALTALGALSLYGVVDSSRELDLRPFHRLFHALRRFEPPPTLRPNATAAAALLGRAAALGEPGAQALLGALRASGGASALLGARVPAALARDEPSGGQLLSAAAAEGEPLALAVLGARAHAAGECERAAAYYEAGARATVERFAARGSRALDNALPNLQQPEPVRMRAGELEELRAWAERRGAPPSRETLDAALTYAQIRYEGLHGMAPNETEAAAFYARAADAGEGGAAIALGLIELNRRAAGGGAAGGGAAGAGAAGRAGGANLSRAVELIASGMDLAWNPVEKAMGWAALGHLSLAGAELPQSDAAALRSFREAAATGYLEGFYWLAAMHYAGRGVARNARLAATLLSESANSGHMPSMYLLGAMTRRGDGLPANCALATELLRPVALRHERLAGNERASVREARAFKHEQAGLRAEWLALAGVPGAGRRAAEAAAGLAAVAAANGDKARADALRAHAEARYEEAAELGSVGARFARAALWRAEARRARQPALARRAAAEYTALASEGYDEGRWQLLTMSARGDGRARDLRAVERACASALFTAQLPWARARRPVFRYAGLWALTAFVRWGKWLLLYAALRQSARLMAVQLRPTLGQDALARLSADKLAATTAGVVPSGADGTLARADAPKLFKAIDRALAQGGWAKSK